MGKYDEECCKNKTDDRFQAKSSGWSYDDDDDDDRNFPFDDNRSRKC